VLLKLKAERIYASCGFAIVGQQDGRSQLDFHDWTCLTNAGYADSGINIPASSWWLAALARRKRRNDTTATYCEFSEGVAASTSSVRIDDHPDSSSRIDCLFLVY
jgi:hypothetical protein